LNLRLQLEKREKEDLLLKGPTQFAILLSTGAQLLSAPHNRMEGITQKKSSLSSSKLKRGSDQNFSELIPNGKWTSTPVVTLIVCEFLTLKEKFTLLATSRTIGSFMNLHFMSLINRKERSFLLDNDPLSVSAALKYDPSVNYAKIYKSRYLKQLITVPLYKNYLSVGREQAELKPLTTLLEAKDLVDIQMNKEFCLARCEAHKSVATSNQIIMLKNSLPAPKASTEQTIVNTSKESAIPTEVTEVCSQQKALFSIGTVILPGMRKTSLFGRHLLSLSKEGKLICSYFSDNTKFELSSLAECFELPAAKENSGFDNIWPSNEFALVAGGESKNSLCIIDMRPLLKPQPTDDISSREKIYNSFVANYTRSVNNVPSDFIIHKACVGMSRAFIIDNRRKLWQIDLLNAEKPVLEENKQIKGGTVEDIWYTNGYYFLIKVVDGPKPLQKWTCEEVGNWARGMGLDEQTQKALRNWRIGGAEMAASRTLWSEELGIKR
jgi:hypothetical protein